MADPVTIALVAGTAMQAVGAIQQGNAQAAQYRAQAQANEYNARVQRMQAESVAQQTSAAEDLQRRRARAVMGDQLASTAQSGVQLNGSASDLFRQSLVNAEQDALNVRYEGEMNRIGMLNQAQLSDWEAGVMRSNAKTAKRAGYISAAASLAQGGYMYSKMGPSANAFADRAGAIGTGSAGRPRTITGGR